MIITMRPVPMTVAAGTATCASTLATATAVPARGRWPRAISAVSPPARAPRGRSLPHLVADDVAHARVQRREKVRAGEAFLLAPDGLVARGASVARLHAGQLPDDPIGGLDQTVGGLIDLGRLVQDLQGLGKEPLGRDLAAIARQPGLAALGGHLVERLASGWAAWCFHSLTQACGLSRYAGRAHKGVPSALSGEHGAGGKVDADADHVLW